MKSNVQTLQIITWVLIVSAASILLNDINEFRLNRFTEFQDWAATANPDKPISFKENFMEWAYYSLTLAMFVIRGLLIYAFTHFLTILREIEKGNYYGTKVSDSFKKVGNAFISYTIGLVVVQGISAFTLKNDLSFIQLFKTELTYLIPAALGFFILAELFKQAQTLKDENDLTI
ncbi:DUF2975 domain-containing protein [Gilvibacter sp.]|uniref:DUF2975 domain-containing protein n=1 Tax=Gilvibacter sp. TaxID=2729997 RepID=UPI0025BD45D9|nr:DUF2975 domain-containing protein [Gilvibacter sp.]NQX76452.1 DUF2975 domain-containing protein [Gilvibacter sp.]